MSTTNNSNENNETKTYTEQIMDMYRSVTDRFGLVGGSTDDTPNIQEEVKEKKEDVEERYREAKENIKEKAKDAKERFIDAADSDEQATENGLTFMDILTGKIGTANEKQQTEAEETTAEKMEEVKNQATEKLEEMQEKTEEMKDTTSEKLEGMKDKTEELKANAQERLSEAGSALNEKVAEVEQKVGDWPKDGDMLDSPWRIDPEGDSLFQKVGEMDPIQEEELPSYKEKLSNVAQQTMDTMNEARETMSTRIEEAKETLAGLGTEEDEEEGEGQTYGEALTDAVEDVQDAMNDKLDDVKERLEELRSQEVTPYDEAKEKRKHEEPPYTEKLTEAAKQAKEVLLDSATAAKEAVVGKSENDNDA